MGRGMKTVMMDPTGLEIKNAIAGEGQQQFA
jgi:hypothetical protein